MACTGHVTSPGHGGHLASGQAFWCCTCEGHARQLRQLQGVRLLALSGSEAASAGSLEAAQQEGPCAALRPQAPAKEGAAAVARHMQGRVMPAPISSVASCLAPLRLAAELAHVRLAGAAGVPGSRPAHKNMHVSGAARHHCVRRSAGLYTYHDDQLRCTTLILAATCHVLQSDITNS